MFRKYPFLSATLLMLALITSAFWVGMITALTAIVMVGIFQAALFALSRRRAICFSALLTEEQIGEFKSILKEMESYKGLFPQLKDLASVEGGFAAIKQLPALLSSEKQRADKVEETLRKVRKQLATFEEKRQVRWVGGVPFVTDDCARALTSVFVLETARLGEAAMRALRRDESAHENLIRQSAECLGIELKGVNPAQIRAALTTSEVPVPTVFVPQIIELVFAFGQARQYATVFPLGAGDVRLPRLKAGEDDFGYLGVGTAGMSQSVGEKRVTAELVTFTANKAGGLIRIPTELEEDTFIQLGQFLARYIARQLAKLEDKTLFLGDGTSTYANQTGVGKYCDTNTAYLLQLAAGKTKPSDATLDDFRNLRALVSAAVLGNMAANGQTNAAYYLHPTWEPFLRGFNKYPNFIVFENQNGRPMLDGWPVRWVGVSQAFQTAAAAAKYCAFFGDLSYWYLGERGQVRVEVSREVFFATDELAMRALERIDVEAMAVDAMATLETAAV